MFATRTPSHDLRTSNPASLVALLFLLHGKLGLSFEQAQTVIAVTSTKAALHILPVRSRLT